MAQGNARQALVKIFNKYKITPNELLFDYFLKANKDGKFEEPLLIGISDTAVILIRRRQTRCCVSLVYYLLPLDIVLLTFGCCHTREVTLQSMDDQPVRAQMADCGRLPQAVAKAWRNWTNFKFYIHAVDERMKKSRIRQGSFKINRNLSDPFEDVYFENISTFLVDRSYFHFWLWPQDGKGAKRGKHVTGFSNGPFQVGASAVGDIPKCVSKELFKMATEDFKEAKEKKRSKGCCG